MLFLIYRIHDVRRYARFFGRTIADAELGAEFFNWTCSGFEVRYAGGTLKAELLAVSELAPLAADGTREEPWAAVFADGAETPSLRFALTEPRKWYTLYESADGRPHTIRVVKLTECAKGKTGLAGLECGALEPLPDAEPACRLEFVGDSITCGFGDEAAGADSPFRPAEENGWVAYAALAARKLNAGFRCVSVSGIPVSNGAGVGEPFRFPLMPELYPYADRLCEMSRGKTSGFEPWDFARHPVDAVCLNLGTNDYKRIQEAKDRSAEQEDFRARYAALLEEIRRLNGPGPELCCLLGPMDDSLAGDVRAAVKRYRERSGDRRASFFRFSNIDPLREGVGAVGHPSAATHARMAGELYAFLRPLLRPGAAE